MHSRMVAPSLGMKTSSSSFSYMTFRILTLVVATGNALWPFHASANTNRPPNFVVVMADDMGFSDLGSHGGEIATPNLDRLAYGGLRFVQFYNTGRCWPTRASMLTGYYAQQIRMDPPSGRLPQWAHLLPQYLKSVGYRSYHSGKWHVNGAPKPVADGGFDQSYVAADSDRHFYPIRHEQNDQPLPPVEPGTSYYSTTAIIDHAIECLREHDEKHADKPFFQYVAFLAPHFPLHALPSDIAAYRDRYTVGWDVIRQQRAQRVLEIGISDCKPRQLDSKLRTRYFEPRFLTKLGPAEVDHAVPWHTLTADQQHFQAGKMAIHAAMVHRIDLEIGRLLQQLQTMNAFDNTVFMFLSDNGADATILIRGDGHDSTASPGSGPSYLCLGPGWASACNSPFHRHKIWVHEGGIATPLIVHWPNGIHDRGELRRTVGHVIDILPTLLELAGVKRGPASSGNEAPPLAGLSLVPSFSNDDVIKRKYLFFHHQGNRALRMGHWKIVSATDDGNAWQLYNLEDDRGETIDLAAELPARVQQMAARWQELETEYRRLAADP